MGRPKIHLTPEAKAQANRISDRKYAQTEKGRATIQRSNRSAAAKARFARYRLTDGYKDAQRRYRESQLGRAAASGAAAREQTERPERIKARAAVASAIRQGTYRPTSCGSCGRAVRPDAHHHLDYAEAHWLDVTWLCRLCHKAAHGY